MTYLQMFKRSNIPITWTVILIGIEGPGKKERLLVSQDIINYAIELIELNDNYPQEILKLASATNNEEEYIKNLVVNLAQKEKLNRNKELKKWIVILLKETLNKLPESPLYGLIALTEFWESFDYPDYSPHIVQGRGNDIKPEDYYLKEFYEYCVFKHKQWINDILKPK
ncbi:DUF2247 family protein [Paenibacillus hunanensis]|uniref:DUF2247 domain-containing protein n=1 Tax=Paenibacillus hunanensis TaxID=539262 RepID=A0ABU1J798_9BACL|nr:DUF2247 family protein [Paenibacillus hunanensis]MCL9663123.1 DUF2247 family protein [Paenibacillus hunanensis]MDR6246353.1 hypothetical protein [Paenibacillus hunanensis]GGJ30358.1 hypothetical protein GCM10008022_43960 [Paenibacillus hunanensis]